jgi:asparagine synthase (glutamine-hydrolysing)
VVFNGEIYNFQELRQQLQGRGHVFATRTDTEVIVHLYEEYGQRCVEYMRGMFGFAVWDIPRKRLLLARDRIGIKPLYFTQTGGRLLFASELKSILEVPGVERRLNWSAVAHLFSYFTTPPDEAILEGIHKLEPGHILTAGPGREPVIERYWSPQFTPDYGRNEDYFVERLRELLTESAPHGERRSPGRVSQRRNRFQRRGGHCSRAEPRCAQNIFDRIQRTRIQRAWPCAAGSVDFRHGPSRTHPGAGRA